MSQSLAISDGEYVRLENDCSCGGYRPDLDEFLSFKACVRKLPGIEQVAVIGTA